MLELENMKPVEHFDFDAMDARYIQMLQIAGHKRLGGPKAQLLLSELYQQHDAFYSNRRRLDRRVRPSEKSVHVDGVLKAIKDLRHQLDSISPDVISDFPFSMKHRESKILESIFRSAVRWYKSQEFEIDFPKTFYKKLGAWTVETRFFMLPRKNEIGYRPFHILKLFLSRAEKEMQILKNNYSVQQSKHGITKNAEKILQEKLFEIFDKFYVGNCKPVFDLKLKKGSYDSEYINLKTEFTFIFMRTFGIHAALGKVTRGRTYNGRLGIAANSHTKDKIFFIRRKYLYQNLKLELNDIKTSKHKQNQ